MPEKEPDVLRPQLVRAERSLKRALDEVCHTEVTEANTGELIRLEEVLAIANEAAKEAVSVRRRLRQGAPAEPTGDQIPRHEESGLARTASSTTSGACDGSSLRCIRPAPASPARGCARSTRKAGLPFDSGVETRRLAPDSHGLGASEVCRAGGRVLAC